MKYLTIVLNFEPPPLTYHCHYPLHRRCFTPGSKSSCSTNHFHPRLPSSLRTDSTVSCPAPFLLSIFIWFDWKCEKKKMRHNEKAGCGKCGKRKCGTRLQGWKIRDMKMRHKIAGVENAGKENAAQECRGGKCRKGKCSTRTQGWKMREKYRVLLS